jgi:hypothetical protein
MKTVFCSPASALVENGPVLVDRGRNARARRAVVSSPVRAQVWKELSRDGVRVEAGIRIGEFAFFPPC